MKLTNIKTLVAGVLFLIMGLILVGISLVNDVDYPSILSIGFFIVAGIYINNSYKYTDDKEESKPRYDYKTHGDFKMYFDTTQKRHYWVLGYFGGGAVNISEANHLAKEYAKINNVPYKTVQIDEVLRSRRFKHFKFIYSGEEQTAHSKATQLDNVYEWLTD